MANTDVCACHTGPYTPCDYPGGCGTRGGCCHTGTGACTTCPVYRPDTDPRPPNRPPVCDGDRTLLGRHLADIRDLITDLADPEPPIVNQRRYERFGIKYNNDGTREPVSLGQAWADPVASIGGVAPINSRTKQPDVTGSRERPMPINANTIDLQAGARVPHLSTAAHQWPEDQTGHLSAATVLDQWVRDIRDTLHPDHTLPPATVTDMVVWLRNRVDDICDRHPAVTEFAEEIRALRSALRGVAGEIEAQPERCDGVPCKRCDMMTLFRQADTDVHCANPDCSAVYRTDEYQDWVKTFAAETKIRRHAEQNA